MSSATLAMKKQEGEKAKCNWKKKERKEKSDWSFNT